ncbi:MAG: Flp family type IVb pilin [Chloroflexota bacterium]
MFWLCLEDERGATMVEYSIMVASIVAVCVLIVSTLGNQTSDLFHDLADQPW